MLDFWLFLCYTYIDKWFVEKCVFDRFLEPHFRVSGNLSKTIKNMKTINLFFALMAMLSSFLFTSCSNEPRTVKVSIVDDQIGKTTKTFTLLSIDSLLTMGSDTGETAKMLIEDLPFVDSVSIHVGQRRDVFGDGVVIALVSVDLFSHWGISNEYSQYPRVDIAVFYEGDNITPRDLRLSGYGSSREIYLDLLGSNLNKEVRSEILKISSTYVIDKPKVTFTNALTGETMSGSQMLNGIKKLANEKMFKPARKINGPKHSND